jgi:hypothetical protein
VFGNKWNDIAAYLPMRCNNDIKNYFNLYLKDKTNVFGENCYLRSGYDLQQLLQHEPDEVMQRRQRLEMEKVKGAGEGCGRAYMQASRPTGAPHISQRAHAGCHTCQPTASNALARRY